MDCRQVSKMMSLRLDGGLDSTETAHLEDHLAVCSACQTEWRQLQALDSLLGAAPMVVPPIRLRVQVMTRLSRRDQARRAIIGGAALTLGTVALTSLALVPTLFSLLNAMGIAPALISGGPATIAQVMTFLATMGRATLALAEKCALPLVSLGTCSLVLTLVLNSLWVNAVRRLRTPSS
jgi:predicted anti-sigma-YlaC factor YlaD